MPSSLIVRGRIWTLDDADTYALAHALGQLEGQHARAGGALVNELTRASSDHRFRVDVDEEDRVAALYAALMAVDRTESPSDTVVQLRLAMRANADPPGDA
jgi:hypothetical protein